MTEESGATATSETTTDSANSAASTAEDQSGDSKSTGESGGTTDSPPSDLDAVASGDVAKEATRSSGGGSRLHEDLRAAQHIAGDQVGVKNVYLGGGERRTRLAPVLSQLRDEVRHAFVPPPDWGDMFSRFMRQNAVLLRGPAGAGRMALAVRLLQAAQARTIFTLDSEVDLGAFADQLIDGRRSSGVIAAADAYVLSDPHDIGQLHPTVLHALREALGETGRLVIIIGEDVALLDDEINRHVVTMTGRPDVREVLRSHLRWHTDAARAETYLARADVGELLDDLLAPGATCVRAAMLADLLSWEPEDELSIDRVRAAMTANTRPATTEWFDRLPDLATRTLGIALAVLDGLPYADVARAAAMLRDRLERLDQTPTIALAPVSDDPLQVGNQQRLRRLSATLDEGEIRLPWRRVSTVIVRYVRPNVAPTVLAYAWHNYQIQDDLLSWLVDLVDDPSEPVQRFAATAIGVLAKLSFDRVWRMALDPLAASEHKQRREAAAIALRAVAEDAQLRPVVKAMIGGWFNTPDEKPHAESLRATAARAHGLVLGPSDLETTLSALGRLSTVGNLRVAIAIGEALGDLVLTDSTTATPAIYRALLNWLDDYRAARIAPFAFLILSMYTVVEIPADESPNGEAATWPGLLYLAYEQPALREPLFRLWHRVLDEGSMYEEAQSVLANWGGRAESSELVRDAFARMVRGVAGYGSRTRSGLLRLTREWIDPYRLNPLPKAAAAVAAALGEDIHGRR